MRRLLLSSLLLLVAFEATAGTGRIIIVNSDKPGLGFNEVTPAAPVGGNNGTTLGQQRLNVFEAAAARWQNALDTDVDILVTATFAPISGCTATEGVLGQAAPTTFVRDEGNLPRSDVWYPIALANKLSGRDLRPSMPDIFVQFNASLDLSTCLDDTGWYYGLDRDHGDDVDLFVVVLHELAHGLGVSGATTAPEFKDNRPSVFDTHTLDVLLDRRWDQMSAEERRVSVANTGNLVWDGDNVRNAASTFLARLTTLTVTQPAAVARDYDIGTATFGASANSAAMSGRIVQALDAANPDGPTTTDGCTAFTNAAEIAGNIALIDRRGCTFVTKARNAQAAGATGVIVVDKPNATAPEPATCLPISMSGDAPEITIPVISISQRDGALLQTQLATNVNVSALLRVDAVQLSGASAEGGYVRLYAPCVKDDGSSTHHFDTMASPNLLMEPNISSDLLHGLDLTLYQLLDMGWTLPAKTGRRFLKR